MTNPEEVIKKKIQEIASKIVNFDYLEPCVDYIDNVDFGDLSTNFALVNYAKVNKEFANPREFALHILTKIEAEHQLKQYFEKVAVDGPGFINFKFSTVYLQKKVGEIIKSGNDYGSLDIAIGKKARVEFVSANPTGPLHIGNARGGPIGDVLANVLQKAGYEVVREYVHNDVGGQVKALGETIKAKISGSFSEENQYQGEYVNELVEKLKNITEGKPDEEVGKLAVDILFEEIISDCRDMGIKFDHIVKESDLRLKVAEIIGELQEKGFIKEKDNALWFAPNDKFLKDRETVVRKSDGDYTYFSSDIVYHKEKFESGADLVIDVFGSNHSGHVPRLQAVIKALGFDVNKFKVILYQYVRVKRGEEIVKMSKRAGTFVTAKEVLDEVGKDALRFFLLSVGPETHMDFDLDLAKQQKRENPVFYVQYAYARISSIFRKVDQDFDPENINLNLIKEPSEIVLIRHLIRFPVLIREVAGDLGVNRLTTYSVTIADLFHKFYESCRVITENKEETRARLALVKSTQIVLKNTLDLLGVSAPERM